MFLEKISIFSVPISSFVLFIISILQSVHYFNESVGMFITSIVGILLSILLSLYWFFTYFAVDGLNTPEAIPIRTQRYLFLTIINICMCSFLLF